MTEQPLNYSAHPEALDEVLYEIEKQVLPVHTLANLLSPEALQELGGYAYQQGAMWDSMTGGY